MQALFKFISNSENVKFRDLQKESIKFDKTLKIQTNL